MIISLFSQNQKGVRGTINTSVTPPTATGVGEQLLQTWLDTHKGQPMEQTVASLEQFYSAWANQGSYSAVEPGDSTPNETRVVDGKQLTLTMIDGDQAKVRDSNLWRDLSDDELDKLQGQTITVRDDIVNAWDSGRIKTLDDAAAFKK